MAESLPPEERILLAAIECINEDGLEGATVRRIAERSSVNPAAISYYYRGKDSLLDLALKTTLQNAFDFADFAASENFEPRERLIYILDMLIAGALRNPGIARAHFYLPLMRGEYEVPAIGRLNAFMDELAADLAERYRAVGKEVPDLRESLVALVAATVLFASTMPAAFNSFGGPDLHDAEARRRYVERLVKGQLP